MAEEAFAGAGEAAGDKCHIRNEQPALLKTQFSAAVPDRAEDGRGRARACVEEARPMRGR